MKLRQARKLAGVWDGRGYPPLPVARLRKHCTWISAAVRLARSTRRWLRAPAASYPLRATQDRQASGRAYTMAEVS